MGLSGGDQLLLLHVSGVRSSGGLLVGCSSRGLVSKAQEISTQALVWVQLIAP